MTVNECSHCLFVRLAERSLRSLTHDWNEWLPLEEDDGVMENKKKNEERKRIHGDGVVARKCEREKTDGGNARLIFRPLRGVGPPGIPPCATGLRFRSSPGETPPAFPELGSGRGEKECMTRKEMG